MELKNFKYFIKKVINEGDRLQKVDIKGNTLTSRKYTQTQYISALIAIVSLFLLEKGFSDNFAGFIISFLGIFIGLFTSIVVSMHDKSRHLTEGLEYLDQKEKNRIIRIRNHMVQFAGLTAYSIVIGLLVALLLSLVLLSDSFKLNIWAYSFVDSIGQINLETTLNFGFVFLLVIHRFFVVYLLLNFFSVTVFSISNYFSFLTSDISRVKIKNSQDF